MDAKQKGLVDDFVRAYKRDGEHAWESTEGRALMAELHASSADAQDRLIGWWDSTAASGFRWQDGIARGDVADGTPVYVGFGARARVQSDAAGFTDEQCQTLRRAALAATPQNIDTAEIVGLSEDGGRLIQCPVCAGEGHAVLEGEYCNYDGDAIGVQFYGIGHAFGAAEAYFRAASPANILALIGRLERAEGALLEVAHLSECGSLSAKDVERQYRNGIHIGSGLPRATCPCGFCMKHRHGLNSGDRAAPSMPSGATDIGDC